MSLDTARGTSPGATPDVAGPTPPLSGSPGASSPQGNRSRFRIDSRYLAPLFITCILVAGEYSYDFLESAWQTGLAILTSILVEMVLGRWVTGKWPHLASAYITGISVGILIRSPYWWPFALCSALAITSKYALRIGGRHLWNPSNFGLSLIFLLVPDRAVSLGQQWGNEMWPMFIIWALGCLIVWRFNRLNITLTYVASFVFFSYLRSCITGDPFQTEVAPLTGPMYQLYVFFMITDPRTTTRAKWSQCLVAFLIAAVEMGLRLYGSLRGATWAVHSPYYALFMVGPITNLIEVWLSRQPQKMPIAAQTP